MNYSKTKLDQLTAKYKRSRSPAEPKAKRAKWQPLKFRATWERTLDTFFHNPRAGELLAQGKSFTICDGKIIED
jgi:hypothetical protein